MPEVAAPLVIGPLKTVLPEPLIESVRMVESALSCVVPAMVSDLPATMLLVRVRLPPACVRPPQAMLLLPLTTVALAPLSSRSVFGIAARSVEAWIVVGT